MRRRAVLTGALAVALFGLVAVLGLQVGDEVRDRRAAGLCRPDHGIAGATASEERSWFPLGDRCTLALSDGTLRVHEPGWALTLLCVTMAGVLAAGAVAPAGSAWRRLAWVVAVPALPVAAFVFVTLQPKSLTRLAALTSVAVSYGAVLGGLTAAAAWSMFRGRILPTVLGAWLVWSLVLFETGRSAITG